MLATGGTAVTSLGRGCVGALDPIAGSKALLAAGLTANPPTPVLDGAPTNGRPECVRALADAALGVPAGISGAEVTVTLPGSTAMGLEEPRNASGLAVAQPLKRVGEGRPRQKVTARRGLLRSPCKVESRPKMAVLAPCTAVLAVPESVALVESARTSATREVLRGVTGGGTP